MADIYKEKGELDKAVDEITIASILNRNNPKIKKSLNDIYKLKKLKRDEWVFNPQFKIDSIDKYNVNISFDSDWLGYAIVKALYKYEPGYKESMGVEKGIISSVEEKECFVCLVPTFNRKRLRKHPEFKALKRALEKSMVNEYIFYEIFLPEHPYIAYQLSEDFIFSIKEYVKQIRGKRR